MNTYREDFKNKLKTRIGKIETLEMYLSDIQDMLNFFNKKELSNESSNELQHGFRTSYNKETAISNKELITFLNILKENRENEITELYEELLTLKASQL